MDTLESDAVDQSMSRRKCTFLVLLVSMELALYRGECEFASGIHHELVRWYSLALGWSE